MGTKNEMLKYAEYKKEYHRIKWLFIVGLILCAAITSILVYILTKNPDAVGLSAAVVIALSGSTMIYVLRQIRMKHSIIIRDERMANLQYKAMMTSVKIFIFCAIVLCFSVWFAELFGVGKFDVAVPFTDVLAYGVIIILCMYLTIYFYYQRKM